MGRQSWEIEPWVHALLVAMGRDDPGGVISAALAFLVDALEVSAGYAAIGPGIEARNPRWHVVHGDDPELASTIRARNSTTIMREALDTSSAVRYPAYTCR